MIALPPGCKVSYSIWIDVDVLTDSMCEWFEMIGGTVAVTPAVIYSRTQWVQSTHPSKSMNRKTVQYGKAKSSYCRQDGTGSVKINFHGDDASTASMFLLKFMDHVQAHNIQQEFELIK
jgi:hypothetical protein